MPTLQHATTLDDLVESARATIDNLTPAQVQARLFEPTPLLVDLREPDERDRDGFIAGSVSVPRGMLEFVAATDSPLHDPVFQPDRPVILYCSKGARSALAGQTLRVLGYRDVSHLADGFTAWRDADFAIAGLAPWHRQGREVVA